MTLTPDTSIMSTILTLIMSTFGHRYNVIHSFIHSFIYLLRIMSPFFIFFIFIKSFPAWMVKFIKSFKRGMRHIVAAAGTA